MTSIRRLCRKPGQILQQIRNRIREGSSGKKIVPPQQGLIKMFDSHKSGPIMDNLLSESIQYRKLKTEKMLLSVFPQNNCCILHDLSICIIVNLVKVQGNPYLIVKKFTIVENFYDVGIDSASVGVYKCSKLSDNIYIVPLLNVMSKCYVVPFWQMSNLEEYFDNYSQPLEGQFIITVLNYLISSYFTISSYCFGHVVVFINNIY